MNFKFYVFLILNFQGQPDNENLVQYYRETGIAKVRKIEFELERNKKIKIKADVLKITRTRGTGLI